MCKRPKATDGGNKKVQYNKYMHVYIYICKVCMYARMYALQGRIFSRWF